MAAALLLRAAAGRLEVGSAGTWAADGEPATDDAVATMAEWGLDIAPHRSRCLSGELVAWADVVLTMTASHREAIAAEFGAAGAAKTLRLADLAGAGWDVADPVGAGRAAYRATADELARLVDAVLPHLVSSG